LRIALNFAWANGFVQVIVDAAVHQHMRHLTGEIWWMLSGASAIGLVNRKLSPYNVPVGSTASSMATNFQNLPQHFAAALSKFTAADYEPSPPHTISNLVGDVAQ